jgi:hypothetical protein
MAGGYIYILTIKWGPEQDLVFGLGWSKKLRTA